MNETFVRASSKYALGHDDGHVFKTIVIIDYTQGVGHFREPMTKGLKIMQEMHGYSSGIEIPEYVIDLTNRKRKVPVAQGM